MIESYEYDEARDTSREAMVRKARSIGLNVSAFCETLGDGNCLYRAVVEALSITPTPYWGNHHHLREEIVSYVDQNRNLDFVVQWAETATIGALDRDQSDLDTVIQRQYRNGTYVSELFITAIAKKLGIIIFCTKYDSTFDFQYDTFWPHGIDFGVDSNDEIIANYRGPKIIISHKYNHFQSLYFLNDPTIHQVLKLSALKGKYIFMNSIFLFLEGFGTFELYKAPSTLYTYTGKRCATSPAQPSIYREI